MGILGTFALICLSFGIGCFVAGKLNRKALKMKLRILEEMSTAKKYRASQGSIVSNTGRTYVSGVTDRKILSDAVALRNAVYKEAIEDARIIFE
jgi:hypothetical protein